MTVNTLTADEATRLFDALSQVTRLEAYRLLARYSPYGLPAGDIARLLAVPHNTLSTHLGHLERAGLVSSRREGRSVIFAAQPGRVAAVFNAMLAEMGGDGDHDGVRDAPLFPQRRPDPPDHPPRNVLVICSGNAARSIMAEAILNREGAGRFRAYSAGSRPQEKPHPMALALLGQLGYETEALRSKSWDAFAGPGAITMDFIITVCDAAAGEACPYWPGHPFQAHWGIPDPAVVEGSEAERRAAFMDSYRRLASRLTAFINLPIDRLDVDSLKRSLAAIGAMEGATALTAGGLDEAALRQPVPPGAA